LVEPEHPKISIARQCELLGLNRSSFYYRESAENEEDTFLMRVIDEQYTRTPFYGYRKMTVYLQHLGLTVNHKRVLRLMKKLGLEAIYPKPNLSKPGKEHFRFPYLLKGVKISHSNQVWATDITYIRLKDGFIYLLAIMDWHSRYVIDFEVSTTLEAEVYVKTLKRVLKKGKPEIFNTDQGSQFTAIEWLKVLQTHNIQISMDGQGRCFDNIFVERLWRTVKYEEVYLQEYEDVWEAEKSLEKYFYFYNHERPHQSLGNQTPFEMYQAGLKTKEKEEQKKPNFDHKKLSQKSRFDV
jgi:putative transposase